MSKVLTSQRSPASRVLTYVVLSGCLIALVSFGVRAAYGLFNEPLATGRGLGRDAFGLAIAIQNLAWGLSQPFAGALADRFGPWKVMAGGALLYGGGTVLSAFAADTLTLHLTLGVMVGIGMGGASYVFVIGVLGRIVPDERRSWALGIGAAAGSMGQFLVVPLAQTFIDTYGWPLALVILGLAVSAMAVPALAFRGARAAAGNEVDLGVRETLLRACAHPSFLLLFSGFFVCGFQLAFITTHLPAYLTGAGFSATAAAWGVAVIGLCNILGAYLAGVFGARHSKRWLLSALYLGRSAAIAFFILTPPSMATLMAFCVATGLLWLSTVPLTSGLVAVMFGTRYLSMLFGLVFLGHQVGSFLGAWLGGYVFAATGDYNLVWWLSILLGLFAAVVHAPIAERPAPRFAVG